MTRDEMGRLGALLFGYGWKSALADALEVNRRQISRWIADDTMPEWAAERLRGMVRIAPPPGSTADEDRDDACADAIEPELTRIVNMAQSAGWHRAELMTAILALTVSDLRHHAGAAATADLLRQAIDALHAQG